MAKFEGYKDIYVFVEQKNGEVAAWTQHQRQGE